jgi:hypothetical protein
MIDLKFEELKDIAGSFAALAGLAYATGYLVLRARARALGTDQNLGLVEEAYVFAGFRFLLTLMVSVLVVSPVVAALRACVFLVVRVLPSAGIGVMQWITLVSFALVVSLEFRVFAVTNVLLEPQTRDAGRASSIVLDGVLGRNTLGLSFMLSTTGVALILALWWNESGARGASSGFSVALTLVLLLQWFMLPICHGIFFADRSVRVLDGVPNSASQLAAPAAVVDRGGEFVTLFGLNKAGERRLVMIDKGDLKGAAISSVTSLSAFLETLGKTTVRVEPTRSPQ